MERTGRRFKGFNRQKTYPGNSGSSISLYRSDHRRRHLYSGRNNSYPLPRKCAATVFSNRLLTRKTYHEGFIFRRSVTVSRIELANVVSERSEERRVGKECRSRWSPQH